MPKKLLLADDSITVQRVIELTFSGEDMQVLTVGDGEEAIALIPNEKPDIILADIGMQKRSGYEVSAFVKGNVELQNIPVLLLAGAFEPVDEIKAKEARCDGVLVKPFDPHHVIARVRELISGAKGSPTPAVPNLAAANSLPRTEDPRQIEGVPATPPMIVGDALDDYFDRLDEAFATVNTSAPLQPVASAPDPHPPVSDRPVLDQDLHSFDDLPALDLPAHEDAEMGDPFAGIDPFSSDESLRVPTLDDLLAALPPAPRPGTSMDFPTLPSLAAPASPLVVAPPSVEPPDLSATLTASVSPSPLLPAVAPLDKASNRSVVADTFSALLAVEQGESGVVVPRLGGAGSAPVVTDATIDDVARRVMQKLALGSSDRIEATVREIVSEVAERLVREEIDRIRRNVPRS